MVGSLYLPCAIRKFSVSPIAVTRLIKVKLDPNSSKNYQNTDPKEEQTPVYDLVAGDRIIIRNNELIAVDGLLINGTALIDYSFVTGEAELISKHPGDHLYAGGRQQSGVLEMEVLKSVEQSYLTQLWSNEIFSKNNQSTFQSITELLLNDGQISTIAKDYYQDLGTKIIINLKNSL